MPSSPHFVRPAAFLLLLTAVLASWAPPASLSAHAASAASRPDRPNIVLILADDLGAGDPRCYNPQSRIPTPHLDRVAREGMRFTDMHSPSAVCSPTRYGLLTGRYAWRTPLKSGVLWGWSGSLIETNRLTLPEMLRRAGYATAGFGKWHLGFQSGSPTNTAFQVNYAAPLRPGPLTAGFDHYFGIPASLDMVPYLYVEDDRAVALPTETVAASQQQRQGGKGFWRGGPIAPGFRHDQVLPTLTEKAVAWLESRPAADPFFLYFALTSPHEPWQPTGSWRGRSGAGDYGDFVAQTDDAIGRVLEALDRRGLSPNTLVMVTSDNGAHWTTNDIARFGHRANGDRRGQKADAWEAGHRVPFLVRWPGRVRPGTVSDRLGCLTDVMATLAAVVKVGLPDDAAEDSFNLLPALEGRRGGGRRAIVNHSSNGLFAIREGRWKLILGLGSGGFTPPARVEPKPGEPARQLYDLRKDPGETTNLYARQPEIVARLTRRLETWQRNGRSR